MHLDAAFAQIEIQIMITDCILFFHSHLFKLNL